MSVTASGIYIKTILDVFDASQEPVDLVSDAGIKCALLDGTGTPNFSTDATWGTGIYQAPATGKEVSGTGYSTGGSALASKTFTESPSGTVMFDAADISWSTATLSNIYCAVVWDDTPTTPVADPLIVLINFGGNYGVSSGTFTIQWAATGIFTIDLTP